jgi:hypothetical protein
MHYELFTRSWWRAAGTRAARTAIILAVPYLPASLHNTVPYVTILEAGVMGVILSLLTSLTGLAEVDGPGVSWYWAVLERVVKTTAQALVTALAADVLVTQINWHDVVAVTAASALGSLFLAVLSKLPETDTPVAAENLGKHIAVTATPNSTVIVNTTPTATDLSNVTVAGADPTVK